MNVKDKRPEGLTYIGERPTGPKAPPGVTDPIPRNEQSPSLALDAPVNRRSDADGAPKLSRIIRKDELPEYVGVERSAIEAMIEATEFPRPIKVNNSGRTLGWLEDEIIQWQQDRRTLRDTGKNPVPKYQPVPPRPKLTKKNRPNPTRAK
jgi:predicted DNA-binding transcriptional regulator AlpA